MPPESLRLHDNGHAAGTPPWAELLHLLRQILATLQAREGRRPADALMTMRDLSERTGLGVSTLERLRARGELPHALRIGGALRFEPAAVERWLQEHSEDALARRSKR